MKAEHLQKIRVWVLTALTNNHVMDEFQLSLAMMLEDRDRMEFERDQARDELAKLQQKLDELTEDSNNPQDL